ncbi:hypothetical protein ANCDUO_12870 [Ancylostoma duodenale]|uniref:Tryptophan synthase beta chain-like PALP domain-containing protein n=1 Tax=Ancylostoma duodenale TaxID=51022 RepID=A0A0C2GIP5_9BILA|nr:hypothetical protein ANCDUO_12870 [Ancylostoma duodenale]
MTILGPGLTITGTIGAEIVEQVPDGDAIFLAIGGGGMASGVAAYVSEVRPDIKDRPRDPRSSETPLDQNKGYNDMTACRSQRVEPSAAVPLAGLLKVTPAELGLKEVVLILCGGNVDLDFVP